jgi:hypothetical protein
MLLNTWECLEHAITTKLGLKKILVNYADLKISKENKVFTVYINNIDL